MTAPESPQPLDRRTPRYAETSVPKWRSVPARRLLITVAMCGVAMTTCESITVQRDRHVRDRARFVGDEIRAGVDLRPRDTSMPGFRR